MTHQENMAQFDDIKTLLSTQWHIELDVTNEQRVELMKLLYEIGINEMMVCIAIVASANQPSRSVRYLIGVIKNRQKTIPAATPIKPKQSSDVARPVWIYHRCTTCYFPNKVRKDVLERQRGKVMRCGGPDCATQWNVNEVLNQYERATSNE